MRTLTLIIILIGAATASAGQAGDVGLRKAEPAGGQKVARPPQRPPALENLADAARVAPPEFGADVLLRLVETKKVSERRWQRELLEEAFRLAASAQNPVARDYAGDSMDTREGYASLASDLKLDALSLRVRAVRAMLAVDKGRARELLAEIPPKLPLPALECEDALVYNVSDFYATVGEVTKETFGPAEVREGAQVLFLQPYISEMRSPAQVGPVAKLITSVDASADQLATLVYNFNQALKAVSHDDRTFSFPATADSWARSIDELVKRCREYEVPRQELLKTARLFLTDGLSGARCADTVGRGGALPGHVRYLNKVVFIEEPISADEAKPVSLGDAVRTSPYWRTPAAKAFLSRVQKLRFGTGHQPLTEEGRRSQDWQLELLELLHDVSSWNGADEKSATDVFNQKSALYKSMIELMPRGAKRDEVRLSYIAFLRDNYPQSDGRVEWFLQANAVIKTAQTGPPEERRKALAALSNSGNNVLRLYGQLAGELYQDQ